jgi:hypothetical protein
MIRMLKIDGVRVGLILVPKCASTSIKAALEDDKPSGIAALNQALDSRDLRPPTWYLC